MNYYVDGAEWCVLVDWTLSDSLVESMKKDFYEYLPSFVPFHIEPIQRFIDKPPHDRWNLYKRHLTEDEALKWHKTDEAKTIITEILNDYGIGILDNGPVTNGKRFDILKRDNFKCQICGRSAEDGVKLEVDHKYPKSKGGNNHSDNLWTLCFECNRGKKAKLLETI